MTNLERGRLAAGWLTLFVIGTDLFVVSPLLPSIAQQFSTTPSTAGWMVAVFSICYAVAAPIFGSLADRVGKRTLIGFGLCGFAVGNGLTSAASSLALLMAGRMVAGLGAAAVTPAIYAITGDVARPTQRGRWLALVGSGLLTALWAGAPIGTAVSHWVGWPGIFGGLAALSLGLVAANHQVWPQHQRGAMASTRSPQVDRGVLRAVFSEVGVTIAWGAAVYGVYTYLGTGLRVADHASTALVALALVVYGIGATSGSLAGGRMADRWGAGRVASISLIGLGTMLFVVASVFHTRAWSVPLFSLWAFTGYAYFPAFQARLAQRFPDRRGMAMAWNNTALYLGITAGSALGGWVTGHWAFVVLLVTCGFVAVCGGVWSAIALPKNDSKVLSVSSTERPDL